MDNIDELPKTKDEVLEKMHSQDFVAERGKEKWHGTAMQADSTPLFDPGVGNVNIIRTFTFTINPEFKKKNPKLSGIDRQEFFNNHWKYLQLELWKDGLVPNENYQPKLIFKKKVYFFQIVCKPRLGVMVAETPQTLQEILQKKHSSSA